MQCGIVTAFRGERYDTFMKYLCTEYTLGTSVRRFLIVQWIVSTHCGTMGPQSLEVAKSRANQATCHDKPWGSLRGPKRPLPLSNYTVNRGF